MGLMRWASTSPKLYCPLINVLSTLHVNKLVCFSRFILQGTIFHRTQMHTSRVESTICRKNCRRCQIHCQPRPQYIWWVFNKWLKPINYSLFTSSFGTGVNSHCNDWDEKLLGPIFVLWISIPRGVRAKFKLVYRSFWVHTWIFIASSFLSLNINGLSIKFISN